MSLIRREAFFAWMFIRRDISTTIFSGCTFMLVGLHSQPPPDILHGIEKYALGSIYFFLYVYSFCIANQLAGIEEDRINKPDRPLPAGLLQPFDAKVRYAITSLALAGMGYGLGVLKWALLWIAVTLALNFGGLAKRWWTKNIVAMTLGTVAQLAAAWEIIATPTPSAWKWVIVIGLWAGVTSPTQDFRDIKGDIKNHRRTLPVLIGDSRSRTVMACIWVAMASLIHFVLFAEKPSLLAHIADGTILGYHAFIIWRLLYFRNPKQDHSTYMLYTYLYCIILASGLLVL